MLARIRNWESWPFAIIYAPLGLLWLYYIIKARSFWFFSNVNPTLEFAGFEGESKKEMYEQLPLHLYPETIYIQAGTAFKEVLTALRSGTITYPFIVKPDIGMQGILFRKIEKEKQLYDYNNQVPADYVIQAFIDFPLEFSVFHIRYPGQMKGKITGFIQKEYMFVKGDGLANLKQLIQQHPKAQYRLKEMYGKHAESLQRVLPEDEIYYLSIAGNHNRGATFINLHTQIDVQLCTVFDKISNEAGRFYYGRYDVKCTSAEDLKAGRNFLIIEFNGAGAEPNHIYDCGMTYLQALIEVARHWNDLYKIGKINKKSGISYWSFSKGYRYLRNAKKFFNKLRLVDNDV